MTIKLTRREALRNLALAAGAASVPAWLQGCAVEEEPSVAPDDMPIEHVIVVMMENRSFDHYFGALTLAGRTDIDGLKKSFFNLDTNGVKIYPYLAGKADDVCVEDPPHGFNAWDVQSGGGKNDGFVHAHIEEHGVDFGKTVMQYYDQNRLPFLYNLAGDFALCQKWFCSVRGPTWPNRWYLHGAQSNGEISNNFEGDYSFPMIYDRLVEKDKTWAYYYTDLPFLAVAHQLKERHNASEPYRSIDRFYDDIKNGRLPNYVQVDPGFALNDDHPPHHVGLGEQFLSTVYHALANSEYWNKCMLVITYDENGGFFDHVPPPKTKDDFASLGLDQLGFRVPAIVAGPYVKPAVSDTVYDHTSVLAFVEWLWDLKPLTQRDAAANNLLDLVDFDAIKNRNPRKAPTYAQVKVDMSEVTESCKGGGLAPPANHDVHRAANLGLIPGDLDLRHRRVDYIKLIDKIERSRL